MNDTIKVDAATLAGHAAWIAKGKQRTYVPVLNTVEVTTTARGLRIRRTDFDVWREVTVASEDSREGDSAVQIDPTKLAALTKGAKGDALVTVDTTGLTIVTGARTVTLPSAAETADFPDWPVFEPGPAPAAVLDIATLKRGLTSVGTDDTLPMLTGVRFDDGHMVTTDRFRMSRIGYAGEGFTALVPGKVLGLFTVGTKESVRVEYGKLAAMANPAEHEMRVRVSAGGREVIAQVLGAEFPKWRHLISGADDSATLLAMFRRADLLAAFDAKGFQVRLEVRGDGTMLVSSRDRDSNATLEQTIAASAVTENGLPFTVAVNPVNLAGVLKGIAGDTVELTASTSTRPMVFKAGDDFHLVMPVRLPG